MQFRRASETWLRSIIKADCTFRGSYEPRDGASASRQHPTLETDSRVWTRVKTWVCQEHGLIWTQFKNPTFVNHAQGRALGWYEADVG